VVLRADSGVWHVALIEPHRERPPDPKGHKAWHALLALPKGLVDSGETPEAAAIREVREETGLVARPITKLTDIKYVYVRTWSNHERVFKIVSFYLLQYVSGEIDDISPEMRIEVVRALWVPLAEASRQLAYSNERKVIHLVEEHLDRHGLTPPKAVDP
jgi:8-oxo-dGTP pyrophosphatase MutT (NUDIX family)